MFQAFDSKDSDNFPPPQLNNYAKEMRAKQTNFLTFNKTMPSYMAVEYAKAAEGTDWAAQLDDTFAKTGVWDFRYDDVANPYAAGMDYNRDMGGPDIFKIEPGTAKVGSTPEYMQGQKNKFMGLPVTKEKAEVAQYIKDTVGESKRFDNVKPMAYKTENAYETYGYKEYGMEKPEEDAGGEMAMFMRQIKKREKETAAFKHDIDYCPPGNTWVNGECIPIDDTKKKDICPYGWKLNSEGRCQLLPSQELQTGSPSAEGSTTSMAAEDIHKAKHKENMIAVEHNTGSEEATPQPVYTFFFQSWSPQQSLINFMLLVFLILLVVFMINYSRRSPMRQQVQYERNRAILSSKPKRRKR